MQIYNYDPTTGRYTGTSVADADREQPGAWLLPAFATASPAPTAPDGHVAVFDRTAQAWTLQTLPVGVPATPATPSEEDALQAARTRRYALLQATDWVVLVAYETGAEVPEAMKAYRQALRDVPTQPGFPDSIDWPAYPDNAA